MIQIPAFNILALGLKLETHRLGPALLDMYSLLITLYTGSMSMQAFLSISAVCPVYFKFTDSDLLSGLSSFSGSAVIVYGTSITTDITVGGISIQDPTWECFIDNTSIGSSPSSNAASVGGDSENNWILCGAGPSQIQDGPHLLTLNANVSQQTFWFDEIQYAPSASVSLDQSLVRIDANDSAIQYGPASGWQFSNGPINYNSSVNNTLNSSFADVNDANLTYEFSGS